MLDGVDTRDPEGRHGVDVLQLQHHRRRPGRQPRPAGRIRRLHRRGGQHDHQVGRQPVLEPVRVPLAPTTASAPTTSRRTSSTKNPTLATPVADPEPEGLHRAARRADQEGQAVLLRAACSATTIEQTQPGRSRTEVSPRFNVKLTCQPTPSDNFIASLQYDQYNQTGRTGLIPGYAVSNHSQTIDQDSPEYIWNVQYRKVFNASTVPRGEVHRLVGLLRSQPGQPSARCTTTAQTGAYSGGAGYTAQYDRTRNQVNASLSKYAQVAGHAHLQVRRRDRAQHHPRSVRLPGHGGGADRRVLLRLRRPLPRLRLLPTT